MGNYKSFGDTKFVPNLPKVSGGGLGKVGSLGLVGWSGESSRWSPHGSQALTFDQHAAQPWVSHSPGCCSDLPTMLT